jgi:hypothetical protein
MVMNTPLRTAQVGQAFQMGADKLERWNSPIQSDFEQTFDLIRERLGDAAAPAIGEGSPQFDPDDNKIVGWGCLPKPAKSNAFLWITFSLEHDSGVDILRSSPSGGSPCAYFNRRMSAGMISRKLYPISCCDNGLRSMLATGPRSARLSDRDNGSAPPCSSASSA